MRRRGDRRNDADEGASVGSPDAAAGTGSGDAIARQNTKTPAGVSYEIAPASSQKRRRVDSDERVAPASLETALPRLARAKEEVENFEAWLSQAASPTPRAGGFSDDAVAKLQKLAGLGDLKTISF